MPPCAEAEARFQKFVSTPPVAMWTYNDRFGSTTEDLFDRNPIMKEHIKFIKELHGDIVKNGPDEYDFYDAISFEASSNILYRWHGSPGDDPTTAAFTRADELLDAWFREVARLHDEVMECRRPGITNQLMGEQLYRQSAVPLPPNVAQTISEFSGAKDPKRVFLDAVKNRGVALPRPVESETEEALRLELAKPDPNQSKIAALRRELARKGGRRTRRTKRRRRQTKKT
jgi:hypothetical protein